MACGGCGGGKSRHSGQGGDLTKFAYLTPRQLRIQQKQQAEIDKNKPEQKG